MSLKVPVAKSPAVAPELDTFGAPPLLEGEDSAAYDALFIRISTAVKPTDALEDIWVRDVVDLQWDLLRWRRLKVNLMAASLRTRLNQLIQDGNDLVNDFAARKPNAIKQVNRMLASAGLTLDAILAQTLDQNLGQIECIERMTAKAEERRDAALREVKLHRAVLARTLRRSIETVEDAEYQAVDTTPAEGNSVA
jgi:hypothetical protein